MTHDNRVDGLDGFAQHTSTSETDAQAIALAKEIASRRPDNSGAIAAMVRKAHGLDRSEAPSAAGIEPQDSRALLAEAIEMRDKSHEVFTRAALAASKAAEMLRVAERDLASIGDVDGDVASHHAACIRAEIDGDSAAVLELPPELSARVQQKDEIKRRSAALESAKAQLAAKLDEARQRLTTAQSAVESATLKVIVQHAAVLACELGTVREDLCRRYDQLLALANTWLPNLGRSGAAMGPLPIPNAVLKELQFCEALTSQRRESGPAPDWQAAYRALLADADSNLP